MNGNDGNGNDGLLVSATGLLQAQTRGDHDHGTTHRTQDGPAADTAATAGRGTWKKEAHLACCTRNSLNAAAGPDKC